MRSEGHSKYVRTGEHPTNTSHRKKILFQLRFFFTLKDFNLFFPERMIIFPI